MFLKKETPCCWVFKIAIKVLIMLSCIQLFVWCLTHELTVHLWGKELGLCLIGAVFLVLNGVSGTQRMSVNLGRLHAWLRSQGYR